MVFPFLYGITDTRFFSDKHFLVRCEIALRSGLKLLQYRDKSGDKTKRLQEARILQSLCKQYRARLIINDDIELALAIQADGVHLGQQDGDLREARKILGTEMLLGATCHNSLALAESAVSAGASYLAFGRFFPSSTKENAQLAELQILQSAKKSFSLPIVAIGGINLDNASQVKQTGANCIAVCESLFAAKNIENTVRRFHQIGAEHD